MDAEKVAIIDLGTNTFHLLITEINERDDFIVKEKYKEPVKLGEGGITSGKITQEAFDRGIAALKKFKTLITSMGAQQIFAFATSAIRSASNGKTFIDHAQVEAGIDIKVINGNEEASLIFEGVKNGIQLPWKKYTLLVDIGGGSVEFIVAYENKPRLLRSLNIGAARLLETIRPGDPITAKQLEHAYSYIREQMSGLLEELKDFDLGLLVGSSGSFETLGSLVAHRSKDFLSVENLNSYVFNHQDFDEIHRELIRKSRRERLEMEGMETMRVDMIVMGSIIIDVLLQELGVKEIMVSSFALKEGIFYRYIDEKKQRMEQLIGPADRNLRSKAIRNLSKKFFNEKDHGLKVSELAIDIFRQLKSLHQYGEKEEELLAYAALLHDMGYYVNRSGHHKHGQYIIMNSGLSGFSNDELLIMGNLVRYHRKGLPTRDHFHFKVLDPYHRTLVRVLAGILRIADNLDRGHRSHVKKIHISIDGADILFDIESGNGNIDIEITSAMDQRKLLESVLEKHIMIRQMETV